MRGYTYFCFFKQLQECYNTSKTAKLLLGLIDNSDRNSQVYKTMIARLTGTIDEIKATEMILDVNGVGYHLSIPFSTYEKIKDLSEVQLQVYTQHKEDTFRLFGFYTAEEKSIFSLLLDISGIGPAMALSILSGITIPDFIEAVQSSNASLLVKIPGIGPSKAEKLIFELQRKSKKISSLSIPQPHTTPVKNDALEALTSLGFDDKKASSAIDAIIKENPDASLEKVVKESLKSLSD